MIDENGFGFIEIEHTADWALKITAADLPELFTLAARGMYWLMHLSLVDAPRITRSLDLDGVDNEALLVTFLSELLYLNESEGLAFDDFELSFQAAHLRAVLHGAPAAGQKKEIKAVTYHNLAIRPTENGLEATIVFDV
ncbi:MAG TPA: archease [Anaerolineaceae bacterium]